MKKIFLTGLVLHLSHLTHFSAQAFFSPNQNEKKLAELEQELNQKQVALEKSINEAKIKQGEEQHTLDDFKKRVEILKALGEDCKKDSLGSDACQKFLDFSILLRRDLNKEFNEIENAAD